MNIKKGLSKCFDTLREAMHPSVKNEVTSATVAKIAAKGLHQPWLLTIKEVQIVCASALTQAENKPKSKAKPKKLTAQDPQ